MPLKEVDQFSRLMNIVPGVIYTMDKAYVDFEALNGMAPKVQSS